MVKLLFLCRRREDITHAEYVERLLMGHVPIALRHHPTLRRYVVNVVEHTSPGSPELDSVGELWFDSLADFEERLYDSPEGKRIVAADVAGFLGAAAAYATTEHVQRAPRDLAPLGTRTPGVKLVAAVARAVSLSHDDYVRGWLGRHAPLVLADPGVAGYKTNVVDRALSSEAVDYDGIAELYFDAEEDFYRHIALSRDEKKPIRADIQRFIGRVASWRVGEYVVQR